jgi:hypothetical protein
MITITVTGPNADDFENDLHSVLADVIEGLDDLPPVLITTVNDETFHSEWA